MPSTTLFLLSLFAFVALALANFVASFVRSVVYGYARDLSPSSPENVILLGTILASGLVINLGTILQIASQCRGRNNRVNIKYTQCLVAGCFVLLVGQVHSSMNDLLVASSTNDVNWATFFATPITTFLSFFCSAIFYATTNHLAPSSSRRRPLNFVCRGIRTDEVDTFRDTSREILCRQDDSWSGRNEDSDQSLQLEQLTRRPLIFLEGTACLGKTTICDQTFDFAHYIQLYPDYQRKNDELYVQSMYEANLYADTLYALIDENERSIERKHRRTLIDGTHPPTAALSHISIANDTSGGKLRDASSADITTLFDRSPFSQIAYAILYKFHGESREPHVFAEEIDQLFDDGKFVAELTNVLRKWMVLLRQLYRHVDVRVIWFGAQSPSTTVQRLLKRDSLEVARPGWNLLHFVHNQNKLFRTLQAKTGFGEYREIDILTRDDIANDPPRSSENFTNKITTTVL